MSTRKVAPKGSTHKARARAGVCAPIDFSDPEQVKKELAALEERPVPRALVDSHASDILAAATEALDYLLDAAYAATRGECPGLVAERAFYALGEIRRVIYRAKDLGSSKMVTP